MLLNVGLGLVLSTVAFVLVLVLPLLVFITTIIAFFFQRPQMVCACVGAHAYVFVLVKYLRHCDYKMAAICLARKKLLHFLFILFDKLWLAMSTAINFTEFSQGRTQRSVDSSGSWRRCGQEPTCTSQVRLASSCCACWSTSRCRRSWVSFVGWSQTTVKFCVGRRHRTRRSQSCQESTACHHAILAVHQYVRPSTTGRTQTSVSCSTTCHVLMTYARTAPTIRLLTICRSRLSKCCPLTVLNITRYGREGRHDAAIWGSLQLRSIVGISDHLK